MFKNAAVCFSCDPTNPRWLNPLMQYPVIFFFSLNACLLCLLCRKGKLLAHGVEMYEKDRQTDSKGVRLSVFPIIFHFNGVLLWDYKMDFCSET